MTIRVLVNGVAGKMGRIMAGEICAAEDMELVAGVDRQCIGYDIGPLLGLPEMGVCVEDDLAAVIQRVKPDVMLDFTHPQAVMGNLRTAVSLGQACVVGTTGLTEQDLEEVKNLAEANNTAVFVAPNFAISAVLMMRFAEEAVKYLPHYEIIEIHNDKKADAPSGTAINTAKRMSVNRAPMVQGDLNSFEVIPGSRGGDFQGARIHSVRLPGVVAVQEVIFGGPGQTLTIRQDSTDRNGFWPGVALALRKVGGLKGLVYGLDEIM